MKAFKTFAQCPDDQKPSPTVPADYPWVIQDCTSEQVAFLEAKGFTVMSDADFSAYLASKQAAYDEWLDAYQAELAADPVHIRKSVQYRRRWAECLIDDLKTLNVQAGLNLSQSIWVHHRMRELTVEFTTEMANQFPPVAPLVGVGPLKLDLMNLVVSGDVETAYAVLMFCQKDDMSQPYHALNSEMAGYIMQRIAQEFF